MNINHVICLFYNFCNHVLRQVVLYFVLFLFFVFYCYKGEEIHKGEILFYHLLHNEDFNFKMLIIIQIGQRSYFLKQFSIILKFHGHRLLKNVYNSISHCKCGPIENNQLWTSKHLCFFISRYILHHTVASYKVFQGIHNTMYNWIKLG